MLPQFPFANFTTSVSDSAPGSGFHIPIPPIVLGGVFVLFFVLWVIYSIILTYHWKKYGTGALEVFTTTMLYMVGSAIILGLMAILLFLYATSTPS